MAKIQWVGIIRQDLAVYQTGRLSENAHKMNMPKTTAQMMLKAVPFLIFPFGIIFLSMFCKTFCSRQLVIHPAFVPIGLAVGLLALLLHEYLHAIVYPKEATVSIGIYPKALAPVALVSYPLKRGRFIGMSLLPTVLGIVPILIFLFSPATLQAWNGFWFGCAIIGLVSPYPDFYNVYQVLRQTPKGSRIQFHGEDTYWLP